MRLARRLTRVLACAGFLLGTLSACAMPIALQDSAGSPPAHASVQFPAPLNAHPKDTRADALPDDVRSSESRPEAALRSGGLEEREGLDAVEGLEPAIGVSVSDQSTGQSTDRSSDQASDQVLPPIQTPAPDIWARIRSGFGMPELKSPLVARHERLYLANPDQLYRLLERGAPYLFFIVEELEKRGMPTEIALLPFIESSMNPVALSPAQAAGLWQFIPATGRRYELTQNWWVDNRRDVAQSTQAALEYLNALHEMNGQDWFLALASYNWGEHAVRRAVQSNRARKRPTDYLSLSMPNETRQYVPKLIALKQIVLRADALKLTLPPVPDQPYFAMIEKTRPIDLKLAAALAGMTVEQFLALNPAHNRPVIAASRNQVIKLPEDRLETFSRAMAEHVNAGRPLATWQPYTLLPGETIAEVAARGQLGPAEVLAANGIRPGTVILPGSRLLVPVPAGADGTLLENFEGSVIYEEVRRPNRHHVVRAGESFPAIARRYGLSVQQLQRMNANASAKALKPGMRLLVETASVRIVRTTQTGARQASSRAEQTRAAQAASAAAARALAQARPQSPNPGNVAPETARQANAQVSRTQLGR